MVKKVIFVTLALVLLCLGFYYIASKSSSDISAEPEQTEQVELEQAKPDISSLIKEGNYADAEKWLHRLIADFSGSVEEVKVIHDIAQQYQESNKLEKAIELSEYLIANGPRTNHSVWLQMRLAVCNIVLENDEEAQEAISTLSSEYSQDPNLPMTLYILAEQYRVSWRYEEARDLYQLIIRKHPDSEYAAKARFGLLASIVLTMIGQESYSLAEMKTEEFAAEFSSHPDLPAMLLDIAQRFVWSREYERAKRIYELIMQRFPDSSYAQQAQSGLTKMTQISDVIFNLIKTGSNEQVQASLDELADAFADNYDLPLIFKHFGLKYEELGKFKEAKKVYQQITWRFPDTTVADYAKLDVHRMDILSFMKIEHESDAQAMFDSMLADFEGHPHLASSVILTAEGYYLIADELASTGASAQSREYTEKAIETAKLITERFPGSHEVPNACCFIGQCYNKLGDYGKSAEFYQKVAEDYPDYELAWRAQFMVGRNYENLKGLGVISASQADSQVKAAYEKLLDKYPDCEAAQIAIRWLQKHKF